MRLDKYISRTTDLSRKEVKRLLRAGVVTVDGEVTLNPALHIDPAQSVCIEDEELETPGARYFMLNKPPGYVCATTDGEHPIVLDLLDEPNLDKLQVAGRLDIDATGLVLITDDGQWNHAITSPRRECTKIYYVCTEQAIDPRWVDKFQRGIALEGDKHRTRPARLELLFANEARITLQEGRYHQIKRMFGATGNRVAELHREAIGGIELDSDLEEGDYRPLTEEEIASIHRPHTPD